MNHPILSKSALSCARVLCLILTIQTTLSAQQWDSLAGFVAPPNEVWSPHLVFNNGQAHIAFRGGYDSTETALISDQSNLWDTLGSASLTNGPESDQFLAFDLAFLSVLFYPVGWQSKAAGAHGARCVEFFDDHPGM